LLLFHIKSFDVTLTLCDKDPSLHYPLGMIFRTIIVRQFPLDGYLSQRQGQDCCSCWHIQGELSYWLLMT